MYYKYLQMVQYNFNMAQYENVLIYVIYNLT